MNNNVCYFYHRTSNYNVTVAYWRDQEGNVSVGASFCRPTDKFNKSLGREIADGRACHDNRMMISNPPAERWNLHNEILKMLESKPVNYIPRRFRS